VIVKGVDHHDHRVVAEQAAVTLQLPGDDLIGLRVEAAEPDIKHRWRVDHHELRGLGGRLVRLLALGEAARHLGLRPDLLVEPSVDLQGVGDRESFHGGKRHVMLPHRRPRREQAGEQTRGKNNPVPRGGRSFRAPGTFHGPPHSRQFL
jgi:hypothetical protein